MNTKMTYEELTQALFDHIQENPKLKAEYDQYVEELMKWVEKKIKENARPVELQFALEYVAAICEGSIKNERIKFDRK